MGLTLRVVSNSAAIMAAATESFGRFGPPSSTQPDLTLHLHEQIRSTAMDRLIDSMFDEWLDCPPEPAGAATNQPVFRQTGAMACQAMGRQARLIADRRRGVAYGYFAPSIVANRPFFRWHFLELAFFVMLAPRGIMGVHGAALVKNGQAVLLRAAAGGGKTTLAYAGARRAFQALAEDVVWLDLPRQVWWGMPWSFHLLPDAAALFPELAPYRPVLQTNGKMKLEVNLEDIRPGSTDYRARPGPVVLVDRQPGQASRLEPLDPAQALPLWLAGAAGAEPEYPNYHHHVKNLLAGNAYRLVAGNDLPDSLNLLESLLANETQ
jgi:hypothetical protein